MVGHDSLRDWAEDKAEDVEETYDDATDTASDYGDTATDYGSTALDYGSSGLDTATDTDTYTDAGEEALDRTTDAGEATVDAVTDAPGDALDAVDDAGTALGEATGADEWKQSETGQQLMQEHAEADGALERFDVKVQAGMDFMLDNPNASVQEGSRTALGAATGMDDEELAEAAQNVDEGVTETIDETIEGTALDNRGTDLVRKGGDMLVGELARAGVAGATGIDTEEGDTTGTVGAMDAVDIGLTVGTAGAGKAATGALRGASKSDEAGSLVGRVLGSSDDAGGAAARSGDEAGGAATRSADDADDAADLSRTADEADETLPATRDGDDALDAFNTGTRSADEGATAGRSADEAAGAGDEAITVSRGDDGVFRMSDEAGTAGRSADEAGTATRSADEAGTATRSADEATTAGRAADEGAELSERISSFTNRLTSGAARAGDELASAGRRAGRGARRAGSRAGSGVRRGARAAKPGRYTKAAAAGSAALVAGGAVHDQLFGGQDTVELEDEDGNSFFIHRTDEFAPTDEYPTGGVLWRVEQEGSTQGYTVVLEVDGEDVILLGPDGGEMPSTRANPEQLQQAAQRAQQRRAEQANQNQPSNRRGVR